MYGHEFDERVPVWKHGDDGSIKLERRSSYWREAERMAKQHGPSGSIGYIVHKRFTDEHLPMTFLQYERMKALFSGSNPPLKIVDYWKPRGMPIPAEHMGLTGFDTEGINSINV